MLTTGTILNSTKLLLCTWFLTLYLMTQKKNCISAQDPYGKNYNTARSLKHMQTQAAQIG